MCLHLNSVHRLLIILAAANFSHQLPAIFGPSARPDEAPFMAALFIEDRGRFQFCGGSILSHRWILTAAHCVFNKKAHEIHVVLGKNKIRPLALTNLYDVELIFPHENFKGIPIDDWQFQDLDDVALLKLAEPLDFSTSDNISTIDLARSWSKSFVGEEARVYGWGRTCPDCEGSNQLLSAKMVIRSDEFCRKVAWFYSAPELMCAGGTDGFTCNGDSGGPLVLCRDERCTQVGIASFVKGDSVLGKIHCAYAPGFFMRVPTYLDWIERTIANNQ